MTIHLASTKAVKARSVTLRVARQAARDVKGERPHGQFLDVSPQKSKELRERFLGQIVHSNGVGSARVARSKQGGIPAGRKK